MKIFNSLNSLLLLVVPKRLHPYIKVLRYLISGGSAAIVHLSFLYIFTHYLGIWYVISTVMAFLIAFVVSYIMQKFWTYTDHSLDAWKSQMATYFFIIITTNVGLNMLLLYVAVEHLHAHYLLAQIVISGLIAVMNYFLYQIYVFKKSHGGVNPSPQDSGATVQSVENS